MKRCSADHSPDSSAERPVQLAEYMIVDDSPPSGFSRLPAKPSSSAALPAGYSEFHRLAFYNMHVSLTASMVVERQARHFLQARDEIEESNMDQYPCLWELKNREHDALLNGLTEMPRSPHELFEILNDAEASASAPFGRLPPLGRAGPPFLKAGLTLMEAFQQNSVCPGAQPGTCIAALRVMRCLRMMLSHRLPSSFNMSTRRTICIEQYAPIVNT